MWETRHNDQGINAELQPRSSLPRPHASMITIYLIWHVATCIVNNTGRTRRPHKIIELKIYLSNLALFRVFESRITILLIQKKGSSPKRRTSN